jgi:hypothetical protein
LLIEFGLVDLDQGYTLCPELLFVDGHAVRLSAPEQSRVEVTVLGLVEHSDELRKQHQRVPGLPLKLLVEVLDRVAQITYEFNEVLKQEHKVVQLTLKKVMIYMLLDAVANLTSRHVIKHLACRQLHVHDALQFGLELGLRAHFEKVVDLRLD